MFSNHQLSPLMIIRKGFLGRIRHALYCDGSNVIENKFNVAIMAALRMQLVVQLIE